MRLRFASSLLVVVLAAISGANVAAHVGQVRAGAAKPEIRDASRKLYYRTELYLGLSIPSGGSVSEAQWEDFLTGIVTPRFPEGFTVIEARGQFRQRDGEVAKEPTKILVFLYPPQRRTSSGRKIEEIRRAYLRRFNQESVLRVDLSGVQVRF